jgi:tetratricopeptide (TPR) repeat protein
MCPAIFLAVLAAYLPAIRGGFVWDDDAHVTRAALRSADGLRRIWFEPGATQQYYPVLHSAFWLEHRIWGDSPLGYHLLNVLLHSTAACLVAFVLRQVWSGSRKSEPSAAAWLAAFLFALHPVCVESVAWISEQKNTLSTVFYLLAALAYLRWAEARAERSARPLLYWLATGLFVLALLSKTVTATLPAALLVVFWWRGGRLSWRRDVAPLLPWFGLGAGAGWLTVWLERTMLKDNGAAIALSFLDRCLLAGRVAWFYLGKLIWPVDLVFIYPHWRVDGAELWQYLFPAAALALLIALWEIARRRSRGPLAAVLFFGGSLFPALGFFNLYPFLYSYVADHFQYLASLGIIALAAAGWDSWRSRAVPAGRISPSAAAAVASLAILGLLTNLQCRTYRDAETLYKATLARNPGCWMAEYNLGVTLLGLGRIPEAIACYEGAIRLKPDFLQALNNLGAVLESSGRSPEAVAYYQRALRLDPGNPVAHYNLGNIWLNTPGRLDDAVAQYEEALRLKPDFAEAHSNLGSIWLNAPGRLNDAVAQYETALRLRPDDPASHFNLAAALLKSPGRTDEAAAQLEAGLRLQPDNDTARRILAGIRASQP